MDNTNTPPYRFFINSNTINYNKLKTFITIQWEGLPLDVQNSSYSNCYVFLM